MRRNKIGNIHCGFLDFNSVKKLQKKQGTNCSVKPSEKCVLTYCIFYLIYVFYKYQQK